MTSYAHHPETAEKEGLERSLVLVTGAGGHLGSAIARGLARDGAVPVLNGRRIDGLETVAEQLDMKGYACLIRPADVTDAAAMRHLLTEMAAYADKEDLFFDGLVNNAFAGISAETDMDVSSLISEAARVNLGAVAELTTQFARLHVRYPRSVVNVASIYGVVSPDPRLYPDGVPVNPLHYGVTKAGMLQLTRSLAVELASNDTRVNAIIPGPFPKKSVQEKWPEFAKRLANRVPLQRLGEPDEIYAPVRFLLRRDASYVTGATIAVDGGWTSI